MTMRQQPNRRTAVILALFGALGAILAVAVILATASHAQSSLEYEYDIAADGVLVMDTDIASINITGSDASKVTVSIYSDADDIEEYFDIDIEATGDRISIESERGDGGSWWRDHHYDIEFRVTAPRSLRLELESDIGSLEISDIDGDIHAESDIGEINIENAPGGLTIRTDIGEIDVTGAGGYVDINSDIGEVEVSLSPGNDKGGIIETDTGSIELEVDPTLNLTFFATTDVGSIDFDIDLNDRNHDDHRFGESIRGKLNEGGNMWTLKSDVGSIEVEPL